MTLASTLRFSANTTNWTIRTSAHNVLCHSSLLERRGGAAVIAHGERALKTDTGTGGTHTAGWSRHKRAWNLSSSNVYSLA